MYFSFGPMPVNCIYYILKDRIFLFVKETERNTCNERKKKRIFTYCVHCN